jgi:uncharacterized protein YoxC
MSATVPNDYVPWHVYERDIQRLSDDIDRLVNKIDGLVDTISTLALSQHHDEITREATAESKRESRARKWGLTVAVVSAVLSFGCAIAMLFIAQGLS